MQRIIAALKGKLESVNVDRKVKRVNRAIETAVDNAQDAIDAIKEKKEEVLSTLSREPDVNNVIEKLSKLIDSQEEQEAIIERLNKVKSYIEEDIKTEGE